jgi:hypothetical protein
MISELEHVLDLGEFISYNRAWDFVRDLENVKDKIDALVKDGQAERALSLYHSFSHYYILQVSRILRLYLTMLDNI